MMMRARAGVLVAVVRRRIEGLVLGIGQKSRGGIGIYCACGRRILCVGLLTAGCVRI